MIAANRFYFEDVDPQAVLETPALTVTEAHATLFAGLVQEAAAPAGPVPDLLPLCLTTGLGWRVPQPPLAVLAFLGVEWEMREPIRVGDTIRSRSRTAVKRALREGGFVVEDREVINQRGEVVQRGRFSFLVAKRPAGGAPGGPARTQEASA
jgi:acyl dehydratase